jgi:2-oxoglutarate dehydrogenase E2 component (dihydrolipoamide succinyltransferase)
MTVEVVVPEMGESVLEATVTDWLKQEGDYVNVGDVLVELETEKVNLEVGAKSGGILEKILVQAGEDVNVGDVLALIDEGAQRSAEDVPERADEEKKETAPEDERESQRPITTQATPVASRVAQEKGVDISAITGTGPAGRVIKSDVEQFIGESDQDRVADKLDPMDDEAHIPMNEQPPSRREERVKMSRRRRTIARRLLEAQRSTAMLTTFNEVDMSELMDLRHRRNDGFQARHGVKLGITSFFIKASISALKTFPGLNAEIQDDQILLKYYYDIGVAIGAEDGLVVPVIRDAERLNFVEIEYQIKDFVSKTEEGNLSIEDLRGGTFTITNGGVFGSMLSTPILNPPQVGILGLHKIEDRPVAVNREVVIKPMMYVALSYDHRIVDGRQAVQFLVHIKNLVEDPEKLLLEG